MGFLKVPCSSANFVQVFSSSKYSVKSGPTSLTSPLGEISCAIKHFYKPGECGKIRREMPSLIDTELAELIADISLHFRRFCESDFTYQSYMKTVFKGSQKGRAYKSFVEH